MNLTRSQSIFFSLGILAAFFVGGWLLVRQAGAPDLTKEAIEERRGEKTESAIVLENFHRSETKDDRKLWEVYATRGEYFPKTQTVRVREAKLFFYREDGQKIELQTIDAELFLNGNALLRADATGGVVVHYGNDVTVEVPKATYDSVAGRIRSPGPALFTHDSFLIRGSTMELDVNKRLLELHGAVQSTYFPRSEKAK